MGFGVSKLQTGKVVQMVNVVSTAVATGTTVLPIDETIPQITEGTEFMTLAITPKHADNVLIIDVRVFASIGTDQRWATAALFVGSTADALAVGTSYIELATEADIIPLLHKVTAGVTTALTFRVRAGPDAAATLTFNGISGGPAFGGITKSSITITEYTP